LGGRKDEEMLKFWIAVGIIAATFAMLGLGAAIDSKNLVGLTMGAFFLFCSFVLVVGLHE
jgi:hypothetical protein